MDSNETTTIDEEQYQTLVRQLHQRLIQLENFIEMAIQKLDSSLLLEYETQHHILRVFLRVLESDHRDPDFLERKGIEGEVRPIALSLLTATK